MSNLILVAIYFIGLAIVARKAYILSNEVNMELENSELNNNDRTKVNKVLVYVFIYIIYLIVSSFYIAPVIYFVWYGSLYLYDSYGYKLYSSTS